MKGTLYVKFADGELYKGEVLLSDWQRFGEGILFFVEDLFGRHIHEVDTVLFLLP